MSVLDEIGAERLRQMAEEGCTARQDDRRRDGSLSRAAACYARHASAYQRMASCISLEDYRSADPVQGWPFTRGWWKPKDPRRDLIRAAALIVAEIERLDRAAKRVGS